MKLFYIHCTIQGKSFKSDEPQFQISFEQIKHKVGRRVTQVMGYMQ